MKKIFALSRVNLVVIVILPLLAPCIATHADMIKLKNFKEEIEGKITELTQDYIGVAISKKDIESVTFLSVDRGVYSDFVTLRTNGVKLECKVTSMNSDNVGVRIPRAEVVSVHMVFAPEVATGEEQVRPPLRSPSMKKKGEVEVAKEAEHVLSPAEESQERVSTPESRLPALRQKTRKEAEMSPVEQPISREEAKEKIKREVTQDLLAEKAPKEEAWPTPQVFKEEIKRELKEEFEAKQEAEEKVFQETKLGRVEGKILRKGQPLPGCEVRIMMLVKASLSFTEAFRQPEMPTEYEGVTDSDGRYHFINVVPGEYKIYWKPPTELGWIRRLDMKPDVIAEAGRTTYPKDIETFKRVIQ